MDGKDDSEGSDDTKIQKTDQMDIQNTIQSSYSDLFTGTREKGLKIDIDES